jgi:hypothetical protein
MRIEIRGGEVSFRYAKKADSGNTRISCQHPPSFNSEGKCSKQAQTELYHLVACAWIRNVCITTGIPVQSRNLIICVRNIAGFLPDKSAEEV